MREPLDPKDPTTDTKIQVLKMNLDILGLQHIASNDIPDLQVLIAIVLISI